MSESEHADQPARLVLSEHAHKNWLMWEASSDAYDQQHAEALAGDKAMAWGLWRIPEAELHILGDVAGKDILEFGCGAARWSIALAGCHARPVGLDFSPRQLQHARRLMSEAKVDFPLLEANAESVPLLDASFDTVFCDWGAMTFSDPYRTVPEVARLLRPGGLFAFATGTPIQFLCEDTQADRLTEHLLRDYFGMHALTWENETDFQLPYGAWIRLFRATGFIIEDLIETQPPEGATSSYRDAAGTAWARRWPMENIWRVRKA